MIFEDRFDAEVEVVPLLSEAEIDEMDRSQKEKYLERLTTNQYESLTIRGGQGITARHDNRLKRLDKRKEWVEKTIENSLEEYECGLETLLNTGARFETLKVPRALDFMGSYLLKSLDVDSTRELEDYVFYVDEREYNSHGTTKDTIHIDLEENEDLFRDEGLDYGESSEFSSRVCRMLEMLDIGEMEYEEKRALLYKGLAEKDKPFSGLQEVMSHTYNLVISEMNKETDKEIVNMIIQGKTEEEIAKYQNCTQQNINKKIRRIIRNMGRSQY